jgi:hypothetical protein
MPARAGRRWRQRLSLLGVVVHALFLLATPFQHHDLVCHLKTPQHCTSCTASPAARRTDAPQASGPVILADAGRPVSIEPTSESALLADRQPGRSPPSPS